jgi:hypothetical protein
VSPASRNFVEALVVSLQATPVPGRVKTAVRYTLDGTEPTAQSPVYTQPLRLTQTTTLRAASFTTDGRATVRSDTVSATYKAMTLVRGAVYLSDLPEQDLVAYLPCWVKDTNHLGAAITLGGQEYPKGLLLHPTDRPGGQPAGATVTYLLTGTLRQARRFRAVIGIDDAMEKYNKGSAGFVVEVLRDGQWQKLYESPVLKLGDKPLTVDVPVAGAEKLRLTTTDGGDGISCDHAEWAEARLE